MKTIEDVYIEKHPKSQEFYEESARTFPGGVTHDTRYVLPFPIYMSRGEGPRKWDVDGNEYIGYIMGHGSLILGHLHPEIVKAVKDQMGRGTHLGANTEQELRWARAVMKLVPSVERIRFHSSGTEATLMAIRLARGFTGRNRILKFEDHFHGWHDYVVWKEGERSSTGIPEAAAQSMITLPVGDIVLVEEQLEKDRDIAAVILEPTGASMGRYPVMPGFLTQLREVTEKYGVLLIFDEVVTGFRVSAGGAQGRFGIKPDLTAFAKILGGGLPGGAVGGREDIMEQISFTDSAGRELKKRISHPGTYNANPLSASAGARCLELISSEPVNEKADAAGARLKAGINQVFKKSGTDGFAYGFSSVIRIAFGLRCDGDTDFCTLPHDRIKKSFSAPRSQAFKRGMVNAGVDTMSGNLFIVSATHGDREVDETVAAFEKVLEQMKREGFV